jgi:hypothetical protein
MFVASEGAFSLFLIGKVGLGTFYQAPTLASHWLEDFANGTGTLTAGKTYKQDANHF